MLELPALTHTDMHGHIIVYAFTHTHVLAEYTFAVGIFPSPELITAEDFQIRCLNSVDMLSFFAYLMQKLINYMLMDQSYCLG